MKKLIRLGLCLGVLTAALTCSALAATEGYTTDSAGTVDYAGGKYTASYTEATSGNQYVILVVKGSASDYSISENTIMYIDQKAAESGTISFDFIPKSTPDCVVLLGGEFSDGQSPKVLGTLIGQGVTVNGTVKYQGNTSTATVALKDKESDEILYTTNTDNNGAYSFESVAIGDYNLYVTKKSYLTYTRSVSITDTTVLDEVDMMLLAGDINESGKVNNEDLAIIVRNFNGDDTSSDINGTGKVNSEDLSALLSSFNAENYVD